MEFKNEFSFLLLLLFVGQAKQRMFFDKGRGSFVLLLNDTLVRNIMRRSCIHNTSNFLDL